jgi:hypothetical protein
MTEMSNGTRMMCDDVQMAVLARLDGEDAALTPAEIDAHVVSCEACRAAVAEFTTLHSTLDRVSYGELDVDVWPTVRSHITTTSPQLLRRERGALIGLAVGLVTWRLAQLLLDLPAPVVNSIVPLALIVLVLWRFTGDPFAIRVAPLQLEREGRA